MPRYVNAIDFDQVALGTLTGAELTTGHGNTLLGAGAGRKLTTGSNNVILGGYGADDKTDLSDHVVLSNGAGNACFRWGPSSSARLAVQTDSATLTPIGLRFPGALTGPFFSPGNKRKGGGRHGTSHTGR